MNFVNHVKTHAFIFLIGKLNSVQVSGQSGKGKTFPSCYQPEEIKKAQILASLTCEIWWVPIALVTDPGYQILLAFETGEYWTAPLCTWQLPLSPRTWNHALAFLKENTSFFCFFSLLPLSCSYTCRHLRRYVYVLDKLYFPHSHCSTLQHCFSTLSDNGEELLSLTCSHILRSYAARLLTSALRLLHAACSVPALCMLSGNRRRTRISKGDGLGVCPKNCGGNGSLVMGFIEFVGFF